MVLVLVEERVGTAGLAVTEQEAVGEGLGTVDLGVDGTLLAGFPAPVGADLLLLGLDPAAAGCGVLLVGRVALMVVMETADIVVMVIVGLVVLTTAGTNGLGGSVTD